MCLLDQNGEPRVTDFGLAKRVEGDSELTATGQILGTPSYMPPEQAAGMTDEVDERADVYSLGAILYCLLTGRPPFQAANPMDTLLQVLEQDPAPLRTLNSKIPRDLETICLKCLRKERESRYATSMELVADLGRWMNGEPIQARPVSRLEKVQLWCKRNPRIMLATALVAVTILVAGIYAWRTRTQATQQRMESLMSAIEGAEGGAPQPTS